jgi:hypothetical protein
MLLRTYFSLFRKILGEEEKSAAKEAAEGAALKSQPVPMKKDRSKSKQANI